MCTECVHIVSVSSFSMQAEYRSPSSGDVDPPGRFRTQSRMCVDQAGPLRHLICRRLPHQSSLEDLGRRRPSRTLRIRKSEYRYE